MAARVSVKKKILDLDAVYTVSEPVGYSFRGTGGKAVNRRDDVLLVQYMLRKIFQTRMSPPLGPLLAVDGVVGPGTHYAIMFFQCSLYEQSGFDVDDGVVHPVKKDSALGGEDYIGQTMLMMNSQFALANRVAAKDLAAVPDCPYELKKSLEKRLLLVAT